LKKSQEQVGFARELRGRQTDAEKALGAKLRNRQLQGVKFRRQQPMGSYIVDFVSFEGKASPFNGEGFYTKLSSRDDSPGKILPFPWLLS
jgi:hypothetical protein